MKNNLLSEKLIYTGESLTPTHLHLCTYNATEMQESSSDTFQAIKGTLNNDQINWLQIHGMKNTDSLYFKRYKQQRLCCRKRQPAPV